jgi:hypothetical protein
MPFAYVNYIHVLVSAVAIFILGGLWYSPALFAKPWVRLIGKSEEALKSQPKGMPLMFLQAFVSGFLLSWSLAIVVAHIPAMNAMRGALTGIVCWIGFAGATNYSNTIFSSRPRALWAIDSGYNLVCFVMAGAILGGWR